MAKSSVKLKARLRRKRHIRKNINGTSAKPRMSVFRSTKHIYVQLIDDVSGKTLASTSTMSGSNKSDNSYGGNKAAAAKIGKEIAEIAKSKGITTIVFDRNGYLYHGRIQALADAAREAGLQF
jgi:large subunit ribosomal protein L18